jgi:hypothetical protein
MQTTHTYTYEIYFACTVLIENAKCGNSIFFIHLAFQICIYIFKTNE